MAALAVVVGVAVLREGSEVVLFLYGSRFRATTAGFADFAGALGLALGVAPPASSPSPASCAFPRIICSASRPR